ncbi:1,4-alpha-glucan branching enzyme, partial [Peribacillus sp. NPDC060186]
MNTIIDQLQEIYPSEFDLYLFHEGTLYESYKMLGAHFVTASGKTGVRFAVWAPHAKQVSVVGNFNNWNGNDHSMERIERSGIWVLFVPGLQEGELYKYEIHTPGNKRILKADPYAFYSEVRPNTASIIKRLDNFEWQDSKWIADRKKENIYHKPMSIYEVHPGT